MPEVKETDYLPDLAPAGLALLVIFGLLIWYDRPSDTVRPFDPYLQHEDPHITAYAYESWLWQDPFAFDPPDPKEKKSKGYCKKQLIEEISAIESPVKILAPLLKVRPDTLENKELRTRHRYAVIAGLIESGYRSIEPDRLYFCSTQGNKEYDVRWEHFRYEPEYPPGKNTRSKNKTAQPSKNAADNKPDIIVVWLNGEIFTDDNRFDQMSGSLFKSEEISEVNFSIYDLNNILDKKSTAKITEKINRINDENCRNKNIELKRIETDEKALAKKLTEELRLRNIKELSEVIIITEQDSESARDLSNNFCESLSSSFAKDKSNANAKDSTCEIKNVFYLKGLDAYPQTIQKQDKDEDNQAINKWVESLSVGFYNPAPPAVGPSHGDYFHRLAGQIKAARKEIDLQKRDTGIKAVGIFGSDFYDKLLILEALRGEMPNILVFTTDLDAQMLQSEYWRSTRNLIVASHFNLLLDKEYQYAFPPFRDSQQTSIFYTIKALTNDIKKSQIPVPQIFEIGRNGPVPLVQEKNEGLNYHPLDYGLEQTKKSLALLTMIIFSLIAFYWKIRADSGKLSMGLSLSIGLWLATSAIFAIAWFFATDKSGEALSLTNGTSLWPPIFIQLIAALLAWGAFPYSAMRHLDENFHHLNRQYFQTDLTDRRWPSGIPSRAFLSLVLIAITIAIYARNEVSPSEFQFLPCLALLFLVEFVGLLAIRSGKGNSRFKSFRDWIKKDYCRDKKDYENCLWREYYYAGRFDQRVSRIVAIWPLFAIIETILIYLVPPWPSPCRGPTCAWASWTWVTTFSLSMTFLFFILDALWLSLYWIRKLRTQHPLLANRIPWEDKSTFWVAIRNKPLESLENIVAVVAERTQVVDRLIYYPMLCIMLMLFARITYFDNQDFPLSKGITFAISISLLFFSAFMLRYEASKLKRSVMQCAENLGKYNRSIQPEVDRATKRINDVSAGAFQPLFGQPVMRALLIILASISLFVGEYLKFFG